MPFLPPNHQRQSTEGNCANGQASLKYFAALPWRSNRAMKGTVFCLCGMHYRYIQVCAVDHTGTHVVRLLLIAVLVTVKTDRQRSMSRRPKPYCYNDNDVRRSTSLSSAAAAVSRDYCSQLMTSRTCSPGGRRSIAPMFQRLLKLVVSTRRRHKV